MERYFSFKHFVHQIIDYTFIMLLKKAISLMLNQKRNWHQKTENYVTFFYFINLINFEWKLIYYLE